LAPNKTTVETPQALGDALRKHMKLKELHLHNNKLGYEGVEKLAQELAKPLSKNSSRPGNKILQILVKIF
jgi:Ran GTPase-activating protein (RanGAP) involved in mRNA processing and transport